MGLHMQVIIALLLGIKRNGHIFFGLIAGVIIGILMHTQHAGTAEGSIAYNILYSVLDFLGQAFIRLIQMIIIPLIILKNKPMQWPNSCIFAV